MEIQFLPPQINSGESVLHLKLYEGTAFDYSLNSHSGTLQATSTYAYPGCLFDGDSDYIEMSDHADFTFALSAFSISAWVNMVDATNFTVASKGILDTNGEWLFYCESNDYLTLLVFDEDTNDCYIGRKFGTAMTQNVWTQVGCSYDGGTTSAGIKVYRNGTQVDNAALEANAPIVTMRDGNSAVWVGRYDTAYANGKIDDVIIYNKELSAVEFKSIYETTRRRYGV